MASFLSSAELDFDAYKLALRAFLKSQDKFKDYDFDGPNMSVLLDLLARNTYHTGFYLNMVGSEMFLDTAQLRESVVSRAKELNYVPRSRASSTVLVNVTVTPNDSPSIITIPRFYTFSSRGNEGMYLFSTNEPTIIKNDGGLYTATNVQLFEGRVVSEYFVANTDSRYVISSANVDITSIDVNVQNSMVDTSNTSWRRAENLYGLTPNTEVFFLQGIHNDKYEIIFGNGVHGKNISIGNVIKVTYRDCMASEADGLTKFSPISNIDGYSGISVTLAGSPSSGGAEKETIDSIRFNAPRHFATQQRAITKTDYRALIVNQFPQIESIAVFGGEELLQKRYGKVVVACKPYGQDAASDALKNLILAYISDKTSVAIDPIFLDPDYFFIEINSTVSYDTSLTNKPSSQIRSIVMDAILAYSAAYLYDFSADLRHSRLIAAIDNADPSIVSNDTTFKALKRIAPARETDTSYVIEFGNQIKIDSDEISITSSPFFMVDGENTVRAFLQDDRNGNLFIYTDTTTGTRTILVEDLGVVDYVKGVVTINNINVLDYAGHIDIKANLKNKDFVIKRNQILLISGEDLTVNVVQAKF